MGDNNEQEAADLAAMNNDDDDDTLLEVIYRGDQLVNIPNVPFRLIIHASVTEIDEDACYDCTTLTEVIFRGTNVTRIGRHAFCRCRILERIELPAGLLRLESFAFEGCTSLRGQIVIPASVQYMGDCVFERCTSLESVVFVPTSNVELGYYMFRDCSDLRFVTLPHNLRSIPAGFFYDCTSLAHLQIPVSVTEIEVRAFRGSGLRSVTISENVRQISWAAFRDCAFLERITFRSTNIYLHNAIFVNCPLLSTIMIAPWLWPKLFASMKEHPEFIFKFLRHYQTQILDVETPTDVRPF